MKITILKSTFFMSILAMPMSLAISCSIFGGYSTSQRSDLEFYNYEDYIDPISEEGLNESYIYSVYGDLPEFRNYLKAERAIGGVGSDYFNVSLAKQGLIMKLDLARIFDLPADRALWESELEKIYTPETWKILNSFDQALNDFGAETFLNDEGEEVKRVDVDKDGIKDHLWEYSIPYFSQNKVIAFNKNAIDANSELGKIIDDQQAIQDYFASETDLSYEMIFKNLKAAGATSITINDYMRDNMMIGAEVIERDKGIADFKTSGVIENEAAGKAQIDAFEKLINRVQFSKTVWTTNGTDALENIVTQADGKYATDIALIYNGDAMAAYEGGYNQNSISGETRIVIPKNSSFITDGIVLSVLASHDRAEQDRFYYAIRKNLTEGAQTNADYEGFTSLWNRVWANFDYNVYTPSYKNVYEHMEKNYFSSINDEFILTATHQAAIGNQQLETLPNISEQTLAQPIGENLQTILENYYNRIKN